MQPATFFVSVHMWSIGVGVFKVWTCFYFTSTTNNSLNICPFEKISILLIQIYVGNSSERTPNAHYCRAEVQTKRINILRQAMQDSILTLHIHEL